MAYTNTLYIAANLIFDLETGKTTQVLQLANREDDATNFTQAEVNTYMNFVKERARNIQWHIEKSNQRPGTFVIKGIQNA
jgi:outer membrane cobalamin receptor